MAKLTDSAPSGMLDNVDITIVKAYTGNDVPYPQSDKTADSALVLDVSTDDGQVQQVILSAGKTVHAHENGYMFKETPKDNSKAKIFIMSLVDLKFPGIEEDVRVFEGAKIHVKTIKYESNIKRGEGEREPTALVATAIVSLPGKGAAKARPSTPASRAQTAPAAAPTGTKTASGASATSNGDVDEQAREQVLAALASAPELTLTKPRLGTAVITAVGALKGTRPEVFANLVAINKVVRDSAWLAAQAQAGGWTLDGDNIRLG